MWVVDTRSDTVALVWWSTTYTNYSTYLTTYFPTRLPDDSWIRAEIRGSSIRLCILAKTMCEKIGQPNFSDFRAANYVWKIQTAQPCSYPHKNLPQYQTSIFETTPSNKNINNLTRSNDSETPQLQSIYGDIFTIV